MAYEGFYNTPIFSGNGMAHSIQSGQALEGLITSELHDR